MSEPKGPEPVQPTIEDGVGLCADTCPSHDGKRCRVLGFRAPEGDVCPPWVAKLIGERDAQSVLLSEAVAALRESHEFMLELEPEVFDGRDGLLARVGAVLRKVP